MRTHMHTCMHTLGNRKPRCDMTPGLPHASSLGRAHRDIPTWCVRESSSVPPSPAQLPVSARVHSGGLGLPSILRGWVQVARSGARCHERAHVDAFPQGLLHQGLRSACTQLSPSQPAQASPTPQASLRLASPTFCCVPGGPRWQLLVTSLPLVSSLTPLSTCFSTAPS